MGRLALKRVLDLAIAIQQIPAPTFFEAQRAEFIKDQFIGENLADVHMDEIHNFQERVGWQK